MLRRHPSQPPRRPRFRGRGRAGTERVAIDVRVLHEQHTDRADPGHSATTRSGSAPASHGGGLISTSGCAAERFQDGLDRRRILSDDEIEVSSLSGARARPLRSRHLLEVVMAGHGGPVHETEIEPLPDRDPRRAGRRARTVTARPTGLQCLGASPSRCRRASSSRYVMIAASPPGRARRHDAYRLGREPRLPPRELLSSCSAAR